jgi:hypothetical protein
MPIRINLLAEQLAAEEARRRDPVKRVAWAGSAFVALMVLWIASLQLRLVSARSELNRYESKLATVQENSKETRLDWETATHFEKRLVNLRRYSTNRFFFATALDALQQVALDDVRLVQVQTTHAYANNALVSYKTNLVFPLASKSFLWRSTETQTNISLLISNQLAAITNKIDSFKTPGELITKVDLVTNRQEITAKLELTKPITAVEQIVLTIKARDYGNPPGKRVDEFSKALATHPYFAARLVPEEGQGIRLRERGIQPEFDAADQVSPGRPFVPFVIECRYRDSLRANE